MILPPYPLPNKWKEIAIKQENGQIPQLWTVPSSFSLTFNTIYDQESIEKNNNEENIEENKEDEYDEIFVFNQDWLNYFNENHKNKEKLKIVKLKNEGKIPKEKYLTKSQKKKAYKIRQKIKYQEI